MSDKPYRVYRGGGRSGPKPDDPVLDLPVAETAAPWERDEADAGPVVLPSDKRSKRGGGRPPVPPGAARAERKRRRRRAVKIGLIVLAALLVALGVWLVLGYMAFSSSVGRANARLKRQAPAASKVLVAQSGLLLNQPTNVLVLGSDRTGHSDSMEVLHWDPSSHLASTLSMPRDLRVEIPGHGYGKLNQAYTDGGITLTIKTVQNLLGPAVPLNHVIVVDFKGFTKLIDAVGGVTVDIPRPIRSNFDGITWHFARGKRHLDGRHALAYARVRKNALFPADSDVTRGRRQQQVVAALKSQLATPSSLFNLQSIGDTIANPLSTDLSANELLQLGWVDMRAQRHLQCNLGGSPSGVYGVSYLVGDSIANRRVVAEFLGKAAVLAVPPLTVDPFAARCNVTG